MRRRPQPSRRRGLLRAAVVVILLTALLLAAILVVSTLLAPSASAPTPTPVAPTPPPTPRKPTPTPARHPTATPAHKKKRELSELTVLPADVRSWRSRTFLAPRVAYFSGKGSAYSGVTLLVSDRTTGAVDTVGPADPFVRPVWSASYASLLYVRVREVGRYPGAAWTLLRYDTSSHRSTVLARMTALQVAPAGWSHGHAVYLVATPTETNVYEVRRTGPSFLSILIPQPITSGRVSPDGRYLFFMAPASCDWCTLDVFDLDQRTTWNGPSGMRSEHSAAWSVDGHVLVADEGSKLVAIDAGSQDTMYFARPARLPAVWPPDMRALLRGDIVSLEDVDGGRVYAGRRL